MKYLTPVDLTNSGVVKSIRGVAYTVRVNSGEGMKVGNAARDLFHNFLNNVYVAKMAKYLLKLLLDPFNPVH